MILCYDSEVLKRYVKKKSLSYHLLYALEKAVDGYVRLEDLGHRSYRYTYGYPDVRKSKLSQAIKRLRERGLVKQDKIDASKVVLKITELGRDILGTSDFDERKWDGRWRIVIFDIPEQKRIIRDMFRRKLKHWGFRVWQRSVWVTKNNVTEKLRRTIKELGVEKWVAILESDNISSDNNLFHDR